MSNDNRLLDHTRVTSRKAPGSGKTACVLLRSRVEVCWTLVKARLTFKRGGRAADPTA